MAASAVNFNVVLPVLHAKQELFVMSDKKRIIIRAGRRSGKTVGVADLALERFLERDCRILYATPTSDQIQRFWSEVTAALAEPIRAGVYKKNETEHSITKPRSEARIRAKTAWNADTLRGDYADVLILDEWQLMNESAWEEVGAPMLIDNNGDAVFVYTPPSLNSVSVSKARDLRHASKMFKRAQADPERWLALHFTSHDNPYISAEGIAEISTDMTALAYRQEIMAEDIDEVPGALWTRKLIEETRVDVCPELTRVVVGVDPTGSSTNEAGIVAAGIGRNNHLYVIADRSCLAPSPKTWASAACSLYDEMKADRVCGERNYGGDMVRSTIETVDDKVSYKDVNATRGKMVRAEPIAARFEKGTAHLVGKFPQLEDEMCSYVPGNDSPNRMDAMVWSAIELLFGGSLGLIEYYRDGLAAAQNQRETERQPVATEPVPLCCPECKNTSIGVLAGMYRCNQCGVQWQRNGGMKVQMPQTRGAYLAEHAR
jgi:ribosomal protein L37AE/L43A